jgi:hypothetical protein
MEMTAEDALRVLVNATRLAPMPADGHELCQVAANQLGALITESRKAIEAITEEEEKL